MLIPAPPTRRGMVPGAQSRTSYQRPGGTAHPTLALGHPSSWRLRPPHVHRQTPAPVVPAELRKLRAVMQLHTSRFGQGLPRGQELVGIVRGEVEPKQAVRPEPPLVHGGDREPPT